MTPEQKPDAVKLIAWEGAVDVGSPEELQALLRDADRFRKLAAKHAEDSDSGAWCDVDLGDFDPIRLPLAEIADALPALTDSNRRNDG